MKIEVTTIIIEGEYNPIWIIFPRAQCGARTNEIPIIFIYADDTVLVSTVLLLSAQ